MNLSFSLFLGVKKAKPTLPDLDLDAEPSEASGYIPLGDIFKLNIRLF